MTVNITIPSPGESITDVVLGPWSKPDGAWVDKDETLVEIESDKVTLEVPAPESGVLSVLERYGYQPLRIANSRRLSVHRGPPDGTENRVFVP